MSDSPSASFTVLGGPLDGRSLHVEETVDDILIGSDPDCRLCIDLPGVSPIHARVWLDLDGAKILDTRSPRGVYVNDSRVEGQAPLGDGDILWLGAPGEEGSVMIQCRFPPVAKAKAPPAPPLQAAGADAFFDAPPASAPAASPAGPAPAVEDFFVVDPATPAPEASPSAQGFDEFVVDPVAPVAAPPPPADGDAFFVDAAPEPLPPVPPPMPEPPAPPAGNDMFFVEEPPAFEPLPEPAVYEAPVPPLPEPEPPAPEVPAAAAPPPAPEPEPVVVTEAPKAAPKPPTPRPAAASRPAPGPRPEAARPAPRPRPAVPARPAPRRQQGSPVGKYLGIGLGVLGLLAVGGYFARQAMTSPQLLSLSPARARIGDRVTLTGKNFAKAPSGNAVTVGTTPATALQASETQVQIDVPEVAGAGFREVKVPVKVRVGARDTAALELTVFEAPRIHGVSPDVAMPGEEVSLAGRGWGPGVQVRFGTASADVLETTSTAIRVRVPSLEGAQGTSLQVVATMGEDPSNPAPFMIGRLPLVSGVEPGSASPGDVVTLKGRGFIAEARDDLVRVGGAHALLVAASESELKLVVPRVPGGDQQVQVRVRGRDTVAEASLSVAAPPESVDLHFVAEPFDDVPGHDHAVLSTALGPAFLLAPSGGRSAGQRAFEAQQRLNEAAVTLKAQREADLELRDPTGEPVIGLIGKPTPLLEASEADAAAFAEDWTRLGGKGGPVTRERLARWWLAVGRDLVLLLVRGEKPQYAAALAPTEARVLGDVYQAARKTGQFGVPSQVAAEARPATKDAVRLMALRVPATVTGSKTATPPSTSSVAPLKFEGVFTGSEVDGGIRKYITVRIRGAYSTLAYEGAVQLSVPLSELEVIQKGTAVRFTTQLRGMRYYSGKWDGQKISGTISSEANGKGDIGTFELMPGR
jgi:hypothetical protein